MMTSVSNKTFNVSGYILILKLERRTRLKVGALGELELKPGYYLYVGSAKKGIARICRHFRKNKKLRWHIDYLSLAAEPVLAYLFQEEECDIARELAKSFEGIPHFGSSDCKCKTHLFYSEEFPSFEGAVLKREDCQHKL